MEFKVKQFPMNDDNNNLLGAIILTVIVAGGIGCVIYLSKQNNYLTIKNDKEHEKLS